MSWFSHLWRVFCRPYRKPEAFTNAAPVDVKVCDWPGKHPPCRDANGRFRKCPGNNWFGDTNVCDELTEEAEKLGLYE